MKSTTSAVDLARSVFEVAVSHHPGTVAQRRRLSRSQLVRYFAKAPQATVLLEACGFAVQRHPVLRVKATPTFTRCRFPPFELTPSLSLS
jgi:hypothetical protein